MKSRFKKIPSSKPYFTDSDKELISKEVSNILSSGRLTQGPWVQKFEETFAEYTNVRFAVATNSGTSALEILLRYFSVKDKEVIVPTNTFLSSANAVIFAGGTPVLSDISEKTLCISLEEIQKKVTKNTRGVIAVHIAGLICPEINDIRDFCISNNLFLIEDASHASGASMHNTKAGALSDGGAFSFYPTKTLTTGEGGMITIDKPEAADFAQSVRCHGIATKNDLKVENKNFLVRLGYNWRMSEIQALVGYYQLLRLDEMIENRNEIASFYQSHLQNINDIKHISVPADFKHSYYKYPIILNENVNPVKIKKMMAEEFGISCGSIYYPPCHLQPFFQTDFGYKEGDFPVAEKVLYQTITLPIFPGLIKDEVQQTINALNHCIKQIKS